MFEIEVKADFEQQQLKSAAVRMLPKAFFKNAEAWASQTVRYIKQSYKGGRVFKRPPKEIDLRLDMRVKSLGREKAAILIGTGRHIGREEVVYAAIQEHGGVVVAKKAKALTIPFPGVKGSASMYRGESFILKKKGQPDKGIIVMRTGKGDKLKPLFKLRRSVTLPARRWFSKPIAERQPALVKEHLSKDAVWVRALQMAVKTHVKGGQT